MKIKNLTAILWSAIILMGIGYGRQKSNLPLGEMLQRVMDESLENSGAVGVSVAVIFPDGEMWKGASGLSHQGVPLTTEMLFEIASIEKNFQAALALKFAEEGLMALDDPLGKWFPSYPNIDAKITIRQLLNLTSGIDDFVRKPKSPWGAGYQNIDFEKTWTMEEILRDLVGKPNFNPGEACAYSTTNYIVLKYIIEKATQSKQSTVFENRLLKPNHLDHTLADFSKPIPENMPLAHGWFDVRGDGKVVDIFGNSLNWIVSISPMLVYSTPGDMVKWIDALFHKKSVLSKETLKAMLAFSGPVQNEPLMKRYGLGVVDIDIGALMPKWDSVRCYGHLGSQIGYTSFIAYFPDYGLSLSMMFNRGCDRDTDKAVSTVTGALLDVLFKHLGIKESKPKDSVPE
jgi:D-alanyl-D-alanine carboxypeptidase